MTPSFSLAISHTPWVPERVESFDRLTTQLGVYGPPGAPASEDFDAYLAMTERAKNHEWSYKMWRWAAEQGVTHCLFLQDDVIAAPNFWPALRAIVEAHPEEVIALEAVHPSGPLICRAGGHAYTTADGLIGVGYVIPRQLLQEFLRWREEDLRPGAVENITEDTLIDVWLLATGRRALHPTPTIIDHDVALESTYGNDTHTHRKPSCTWEHWAAWGGKPEQLEDPAFWRVTPKPAHLGRFYAGTWQLLAHALKEPDLARVEAAGQDVGDTGIGRGMRPPTKMRVVVATPIFGPDVSLLYSASIFRLGVMVRDADFSMLVEYDGEGRRVNMGHVLDLNWVFARDLVRARSRMVRRFLQTDGTHMLFLDSDVSFTIQAIAGMVATDADFVACPYPRKEIDWGRARKAAAEGRDPEKNAYGYPYRLSKREPVRGACVDVDAIGLGCALISRRCLETMVEAYAQELTFHDDTPGEGHAPTVALFQLVLKNESSDDPNGPKVRRKLLGEDYSFCERWRALGGKIKMYAGAGSPVDHVGAHVFRGHREGLVAPGSADESSDQ